MAASYFCAGFVLLTALASYVVLHTNVADDIIDYLDGSTAYNNDNPFLKDLFYSPLPARLANVTYHDLQVIGTLPAEVEGFYVRNGPNPIRKVPRYHWFDGASLLHAAWLFPPHKAVYGTVAPQTPNVVQSAVVGRERGSGLGSFYGLSGLARVVLSSLRSAFGHLEKEPYRNGLANTAVVYHRKRLFALVEVSQPFEMHIQVPQGDAPLLASGDYEPFGKRWLHSFSAHPKVDHVTGEMMTFGWFPNNLADPNAALFIQYGVINDQGKVTTRLKVPVASPGVRFMHDCAITEHFTIFLDFPLYLDPANLVAGKPLVMYNHSVNGRIGVLPRHAKSGEEVVWFELQGAGYVYHTSNAWEDGDQIHVHYPYYPSHEGWGGYVDQATAFQFPSKQYHVVLDMKTRRVVHQGPLLGDSALPTIWSLEFPRVDDRLVGRRTRYVYTPAVSQQHKGMLKPDSIVKFDLKEKTGTVLTLPEQQLTHEVVFVPASTARSEDDGYLMGYSFSPINGTSRLVVWDAKTMRSTPVAAVQLQSRVPMGFHGDFIAKHRLPERVLRQLPV